jgi:hypothetical protein
MPHVAVGIATAAKQIREDIWSRRVSAMRNAVAGASTSGARKIFTVT